MTPELREKLNRHGCSSAIEYIEQLERDTERLDYLDHINAEFNRQNGSVYGWRLDWNCNRIALLDSCASGLSIREAIDEHANRKVGE